MAVWQDNVISITLHQVYQCRVSESGPLFLNEVSTQLSSRGWVDPDPDLIHSRIPLKSYSMAPYPQEPSAFL